MIIVNCTETNTVIRQQQLLYTQRSSFLCRSGSTATAVEWSNEELMPALFFVILYTRVFPKVLLLHINLQESKSSSIQRGPSGSVLKGKRTDSIVYLYSGYGT